MNEEAGFISALTAEPNDRTTMLVYADWLDERGDRRSEYWRRMAAAPRDEKWLENVRSILSQLRAWVRHGCGTGATIRVTLGPFAGNTGELVGLFIKDHRLFATAHLTFCGGSMELELDTSWQLEPAKPA